MKAYAVYESSPGWGIVLKEIPYPNEWWSRLRHKAIDDMTAEEYAEIYGVPAHHPEYPQCAFCGCISAKDEAEAHYIIGGRMKRGAF